MAGTVRAYIDLLSTDDAGARTVTLVVEYGEKTARLNLGVGALTEGETPIAEIVRDELQLLMDALEQVDASVEGILAARPQGPPGVVIETSGQDDRDGTSS